MSHAVESWLARAPGAGVYEGTGLPLELRRVRAVTLVRQATQRGWCAAYLDGREITSKDGFLKACARAFSFPAYFGGNWDALEDCLRDLSWVPTQRGYLVLYDHTERFAHTQPEDFAVAHDILQSATNFWRATTTPLIVLLRPSG